jgi:transitional endoplasmic reticulum ATPase
MTALALQEGDVVEIVGKRTTPARAVFPYAEDESLDIARLDGLQRANAGVGRAISSRSARPIKAARASSSPRAED